MTVAEMPPQQQTLFGIPLKWVSLLTLVVQNSALVLLMKYARNVEGPPFLASTAVVLSELTKLFICVVIHSIELSKINCLTFSRVFST